MKLIKSERVCNCHLSLFYLLLFLIHFLQISSVSFYPIMKIIIVFFKKIQPLTQNIDVKICAFKINCSTLIQIRLVLKLN